MSLDVDHSSLQQEEWEVLQAIYPDFVSSDKLSARFQLEIPVELGQPQELRITSNVVFDETLSDPNRASGSAHDVQVALSTLPPVILHISLPDTYPTHTPPQILSIKASQLWFPKLDSLQTLLMDTWTGAEEGVLCNWIEMIRSGEFLIHLSMSSEAIISIGHPTPSALREVLIAYDSSAESAKFSQTSYPCALCLESVRGSRCLQLTCSHIFCRSCLDEYWTQLISEGDVARVGCPDPACVKNGREATEEELRRVVPEQLILRYRWLKEKRELERDPATVHCPITFCQRPVPKPESEASESGWGRLRTCSSCGYSFCAFCKRAWHGPLSPCPLSVRETFVLEWIAAEDDEETRQNIELRYGKLNVERLVAQYEEEKANNAWFESFTTSCPQCQVKVQKTHGCNHMHCAKCSTHFCYRCGAKLRATDPFLHYSTRGLSCFEKLFDVTSSADLDGFVVM